MPVSCRCAEGRTGAQTRYMGSYLASSLSPSVYRRRGRPSRHAIAHWRLVASPARHRGGRVRGRGSVAAEGAQTVLRDHCEKYDALGAGSADLATSRSLPNRLSVPELCLARARFESSAIWR